MDAKAFTIEPVKLDSSDVSAGGMDGAHVSGRELSIARRQLAELNYRYLELIAREVGLPDPIPQSLSELSPAAKLALADCPFSLFTLRFDRSAEWLALCTCAHASRDAKSCSPSASAQEEWLATVVFFAWHLAHTQPLAARVLLGMDAQVVQAIRGVPIVALTHLSAGAKTWLAPRWPQHPCFWRNLVRNSVGGAPALCRAHLLGRQLLAAEMISAQPLRRPYEPLGGRVQRPQAWRMVAAAAATA